MAGELTHADRARRLLVSAAAVLGLPAAGLAVPAVDPPPAHAAGCDEGNDGGAESGDDGTLGDNCEDGAEPEETVPLDPAPDAGALDPEDGGPAPGLPAPPAAAPAPPPAAPVAPPPVQAAPPPAAPKAQPSPPPASPAPAPAPAPAPPTVGTPPAEAPVVVPVDGDAQRARAERRRPEPAPSPPAPAPAEKPAQAPSAPVQVRAPAAPAAPARTPATVAPATTGAYEVRAGESLWSIARDQLGAGASPAALARYVQRIWELNSAHIASGDPGMIAAGQQLRLPRP